MITENKLLWLKIPSTHTLVRSTFGLILIYRIKVTVAIAPNTRDTKSFLCTTKTTAALLLVSSLCFTFDQKNVFCFYTTPNKHALHRPRVRSCCCTTPLE